MLTLACNRIGFIIISFLLSFSFFGRIHVMLRNRKFSFQNVFQSVGNLRPNKKTLVRTRVSTIVDSRHTTAYDCNAHHSDIYWKKTWYWTRSKFAVSIKYLFYRMFLFGESMTKKNTSDAGDINSCICSPIYYSCKKNDWKIVLLMDEWRRVLFTIYILSSFSFLFWSIDGQKIFRQFTRQKKEFWTGMR